MARSQLLSSKRNTVPRAQGFTLLETVIAMSILGIFFLSIPGFLVFMERMEGENNVRARTLLCAQEMMEELTFAALRGVLSLGNGVEALPEGPHEGMERGWDVGPSSLAPGLMHVHVRCSSDWRTGAVETELETFMVNSSP